jgi:hypothetical protein
MSKPFKIPDLNAPRYRPKRLNLTNKETYDKFIRDNPKCSKISIEQFKEVISTFNRSIWQTAINDRDGIELPEQLGFIFIGSCPRKKSNIDFAKSKQYGTILQHQNWESDQYTAKIFYTNFETKYKFKYNDLWGFTGLRDFTRMVGKTYPTEWKKYVMVDNLVKVSRLFRIEKYKQFKTTETSELLEEYDEFNLE